MAECHPVGFQWVMEAKRARRHHHPRRPAIHPDERRGRHPRAHPRRIATSRSSAGSSATSSRTSATSTTTSSSYTNAAAIIVGRLPRHRGPRRPVQRLGRGPGKYDPTIVAVRGRRTSLAGRRARAARRRARAGPGAQEPARAEASEHATRPAASPLRLPDPEAPLLPLHAGDGRGDLRHPAGAVPARRRDAVRELRPRAHLRVLLRGRLDAALRRRAVHPHGGHHPAAARQHRPPGRRDHGAARARLDPGLDRHPDAVRPAARLPADAEGRVTTQTSRNTSRTTRRQSGWWTRVPEVHGLAAQGLVRRARRPRRTTGATTTCRGSPAITRT